VAVLCAFAVVKRGHNGARRVVRSYADTLAPCLHRINCHVAETSVVNSQLPRDDLSSVLPPLVVQRVNVWVQGVYTAERRQQALLIVLTSWFIAG
jgi:hypothetical protein